MPKRRVPGHIQRTGRRRRDRQPNVPPPAERSTARTPDIDESDDAPVEATVGRPLRPTLRGAGGGGTRFVRAPVAPLDLTAEYRHVVRDLRQIGLLALVAFLVLGVLAIAIR